MAPLILQWFVEPLLRTKTKDKKLYCPQERPHKVLRDETRLRFFLISEVVNVVVFIPHLFSLAMSMP